MGFRDDQVALRARVEALEAELRQRQSPKQTLEKLQELQESVTQATHGLDADRGELGALLARIEALRRELSGDPAISDSQPGDPAISDSQPSGSSRLIVPVAVLVCALAIGAWWSIALSRYPGESLVASINELGGANDVDVEAVLQTALAASGNHELLRLESRFVRSDGRMQARRGGPSMSIEFVFEGPRRLERETYKLDERGLWCVPELLSLDQPTVDSPRCSVQDVWAAAIEAGVSEDGVASLYYGLDSRREWTFMVDGMNVKISDPECEVSRIHQKIDLNQLL